MDSNFVHRFRARKRGSGKLVVIPASPASADEPVLTVCLTAFCCYSNRWKLSSTRPKAPRTNESGACHPSGRRSWNETGPIRFQTFAAITASNDFWLLRRRTGGFMLSVTSGAAASAGSSVSAGRTKERSEPMKKRLPLTDKDGEVRELTYEDFKHMRPLAEVDLGMIEAMKAMRDRL
jgi:hypothetical protein